MRGQCAICETPLSPNLTGISAVACGHTFHDACLVTWSTKNNKCPNCTVNLKAQSAITKLDFRVDPNSIMEDVPLMLRAKIATLERSVNLAYRTINHQAVILGEVKNYFNSREAYEMTNMTMSHFTQLADEERRTVEAIVDRLKQGEQWHMTLQEDICAHVDRLRNNAESITEDVMRQREGLLEEFATTMRAISMQIDLMRSSMKRLYSEDAHAKKRAVSQMGTGTSRASSSNLVAMVQEDLTEQRPMSVQEELPARVDRLRGDIAKVETMAKEQGDKLLENLGNYERNIHAQSALIECLMKFIGGEDEQLATNHETPGPSNPDGESSQSSLVKLLQKYITEILKKEELLPIQLNHNSTQLKAVLDAEECNMDKNPLTEETSAINADHSKLLKMERLEPFDNQEKDIIFDKNAKTGEVDHSKPLKMERLEKDDNQEKDIIILDENPTSCKHFAMNTGLSKLSKIKFKLLEGCVGRETDAIMMDKNPTSEEEIAMDTGQSNLLKMESLEKNNNREKRKMDNKNRTPSEPSVMDAGHSKLLKMESLEKNNTREKTVKIFKMKHLKSHDGRDKKVIIID